MRVFNETQRFTQWWLKLINIAIFGFLIYASYNWFVLDKPVSNVSETDVIGQLTVISVVLFSIALIYLFKLNTTIDEIGIHYQFSPINLSKKSIRWNTLKKCYVRTYSPLREYGGWGYRGSFSNGKAINIKGNKGIQLEFQNGKKLLIGTQREEHAQKVIKHYFKTKDE